MYIVYYAVSFAEMEKILWGGGGGGGLKPQQATHILWRNTPQAQYVCLSTHYTSN